MTAEDELASKAVDEWSSAAIEKETLDEIIDRLEDLLESALAAKRDDDLERPSHTLPIGRGHTFQDPADWMRSALDTDHPLPLQRESIQGGDARDGSTLPGAASVLEGRGLLALADEVERDELRAQNAKLDETCRNHEVSAERLAAEAYETDLVCTAMEERALHAEAERDAALENIAHRDKALDFKSESITGLNSELEYAREEGDRAERNYATLSRIVLEQNAEIVVLRAKLDASRSALRTMTEQWQLVRNERDAAEGDRR